MDNAPDAELQVTVSEPKCDGCGKRPEVYGSSWCAHCHDTLPQHIQKRILALRNACIDARYARTRAVANALLDAVLNSD
jgi:formate-dependent nitrite reductase cytochrome c552 subunit